MNPGVQKPHCSPWHSANACCTGLIASGSLPMPSTVVISWACAVTANIRQERIGCAVDEHGARAADAVLAADVGAGEGEVVAQEVGQQPTGRCLRRALDAVDPQPDVEQLLGGRLARAVAGLMRPLLGAVAGAAASARGSAPASAGSRRWRGCRPRARRGRAPARRRPRAVPRHDRPAPVEVEHGGHRCHRHERRPGRTHLTAFAHLDRDGHPGERVVAVAPRRLEERRAGAAGANRPKRTASTSSSCRRVVSSGPSKKSAAAISRRPPAPTASTTPPVSTSTEGISPAGSAWAIEPTVVPRLRMAGCATLRTAWRSSGSAASAPSSRSSPAWRTSAPTRTHASVTSTASSPATPLTSTRWPGRPAAC